MRIIIATDVTVGGGVDKYALVLLDALRRRGHDVMVLCEKDSESGLAAAAAARGAEVAVLPLYRRWYPAEVIDGACRALLERARPDGIHLVNGSPRSGLALRSVADSLGIALAITEAQVDERVELSPEQRAGIRASYVRARAVVFLSSGNRDTMADAVGLRGVRSLVINNGVDLADIAPYRREVPRPRVPARIVSIARLAPEKSLATLIEAVSLLPGELVREVNLYGDGPSRSELAEQIGRLGLENRVFLRGPTTQPWPLLRDHDLFVLPSTAEGMPYALLEAMAIGIPVVCTDVPGMVEALAGGEAGRVVGRSDSRALAAGIGECLGEAEETEAKARLAMSRIDRQFDQRILQDRLAGIWDEAALSRRRDSAAAGYRRRRAR